MFYFFHIRDHEKLIVDETGLELPNLAAARKEAIAAARSFQKEAALTFENIDHQVIEVSDDTGTVLLTVPFSDYRFSEPPDGASLH